MEKGWVKLHSSSSPEKMEIMKSMLESNGIPCIAMNQRDSSYLSFGDVTLYVKNTDYIRARGLIDQQNTS